jgi:hypothetical protein
MSQANIPNITPIINITPGQSITLLLSSIALEEMALAHIINAEAEKIQFVLGTLEESKPHTVPTFSELLAINTSVRKTLQDVIIKEVLLQIKFDHVLELVDKIPDK